uniref:Uncharacterized protein n=1 Tax=Siphoviridae sp. ct3CA7 TaxID=2823561 RepID=A0A8S5LFC9_9CAUD|nr:MAG TPA: hypothetical protein [Siphoviridae sp. ct3CA7]
MRTEPRRATAKAPAGTSHAKTLTLPTRRPAAHTPHTTPVRVGIAGPTLDTGGSESHGRQQRAQESRTEHAGCNSPPRHHAPQSMWSKTTNPTGRKNQCPHTTTPNSPPTCSQTSTTYTPKSAHYHAAAHNHSPSPNLMKPSSGQRRPPMKPNNHDDHINTADALVADAYFRFLTGPKHAD